MKATPACPPWTSENQRKLRVTGYLSSVKLPERMHASHAVANREVDTFYGTVLDFRSFEDMHREAATLLQMQARSSAISSTVCRKPLAFVPELGL
eukprot:5174779-Amphidinium_carterae.1